MPSTLVLTDAPADAVLLPLLASALVKALRAELLTFAVDAMPWRDVRDDVLELAPTAPAGAFVVAVPLGAAPAVETKMSLRVSGLCQYCGATSMTTWY